MSQPIRYSVDDDKPDAVYAHKNGHLVKWDDYAAIAAQNDRLKTELKAANNHIIANSIDPSSIDARGILQNQISLLIDDLKAENEVLRKKVEWLQKADRLVIWNGTEWQVRHVVEQPIKPRE